MKISRRAFLDLCKTTAVGLEPGTLSRLESLLATRSFPTILWLQGASCTGCSVSFLTHISTAAPKSAADIFIHTVNLPSHPSLMTPCEDMADAAALEELSSGDYFLVIEGGVPPALSRAGGWTYTPDGRYISYLSAVQRLADNARGVLAIGTCAGPNSNEFSNVGIATGKPTVYIPGCPAGPEQIVRAIARAVACQGALPVQFERPLPSITLSGGTPTGRPAAAPSTHDVYQVALPVPSGNTRGEPAPAVPCRASERYHRAAAAEATPTPPCAAASLRLVAHGSREVGQGYLVTR